MTNDEKSAIDMEQYVRLPIFKELHGASILWQINTGGSEYNCAVNGGILISHVQRSKFGVGLNRDVENCIAMERISM